MRLLIGAVIALAALTTSLGSAGAQDYPNRTIKMRTGSSGLENRMTK